MKNEFELVGGSVIGREHLRVGKNNQDAYSWNVSEAGAIAVVCDGCGSGMHSEVGANLGARMIVETLHRSLKGGMCLEHEEFWQTIQQKLLNQLQQVAEHLGGDQAQTVRDYLLFTSAGAVITPAITSIFTLGDGVIAVNDQVMQLGPFANNAPPYLAYGLLEGNVSESLPLKALQVLPTKQVQSMLLGSDGVSDLMEVAAHALPGRSDVVGDIAQFWQDERYFRNPDQVRRRLALINREVTMLNPQSQQCSRQPGLLPDDTTLIVIRRKEAVC
ncbi:protein phosphatase 2C domain-containing protein [Phormidium sp. FACHB-592]|uniref:Protein phosphatase 2C domain-containing protein n=1 Tax=Stenomitos frigidus AS-A4 TaxID=2933935 RepID=A0ABV0KIE9_9CYAN|nr:protein phosphatase 2C domain-containing protein [Phormidium sp. FACHB-592]MBD2075714.1 protein phosphatase 2C domain-containing protein [Phormidium sp. FACHB-592]